MGKGKSRETQVKRGDSERDDQRKGELEEG